MVKFSVDMNRLFFVMGAREGMGACAAMRNSNLPLWRVSMKPRQTFESSVSNLSKLSHETKFWVCCHSISSLNLSHYENMPIQIYRRFQLQKLKNFQIKPPIFFHASAQNIDCGYSLEPPRRGGSNEYPQFMLFSKIRTIMYTPVNPSFTI